VKSTDLPEVARRRWGRSSTARTVGGAVITSESSPSSDILALLMTEASVSNSAVAAISLPLEASSREEEEGSSKRKYMRVITSRCYVIG